MQEGTEFVEDFSDLWKARDLDSEEFSFLAVGESKYCIFLRNTNLHGSFVLFKREGLETERKGSHSQQSHKVKELGESRNFPGS